jgi:hypothetical protein
MRNNSKHKFKGVAILQLLIGTVIGAIVIGGAFTAYQIVNRSYINQISQLQSSSEDQYASSVLNTIIDQAGYSGCGNVTPLLKSNFIGAGSSVFDEPILFGIDSSEIKIIKKLSLSKKGSGKYKNGSDILVIRSSGLSGQEILGITLEKGAQKIELNTALNLHKEDILIIHDCIQFNALELKRLKRKKDEYTINLYGKLPSDINQDSIMSVYEKNIFYIGETTRKINNSIVYALYVRGYNGVRNELVPNISSLKIEYLLPSDEYVTAEKVNDWMSISEIRFLLTTTKDQSQVEVNIALKRNIP